MAEKLFRVFDPDDLGPETIIGGEGRLNLDAIPEFFNKFEHLILPPRPQTVEDFKRQASGRPLMIEVGAGKGRLITALAAANPDKICLGFETGLSLCGHALARAGKRAVNNVYMAWGDARRTIPLLVEPGTARWACLMFPDPWWKKKHANRRHGPLMGGIIADALAPGAQLVLKSDIEPYLVEIVAAFMSTGRYERLSEIPQSVLDMPHTDREVRLRAAGTPVFTAVLVRH